MADNITTLLNQIQIISKNLKIQRDEKTAKGENFNIFKDLGMISDEVRLHSSMLATLLNPKASHGQKDKYLQEFLNMLHDVKSDIEPNFIDTKSNQISVQIEKSIGNLTDTTGGRIDLYVTDRLRRIIIENKIYAGDQNHQILRYWNYGISKDKEHTDNSFILIYLTLYGHSPSKESLGSLDPNKVICLSYKYEIRRWLERCIEISACQPLIRETLLQYINTIDILTNSVMNKNHEMLQILSKEENLDAVFDILNSRDSLVNYIMNEKFLPELRNLAEEKGFTLSEESKDWVGESYASACFRHKEWKNFKLSFEFERRGMGELIFGFLKRKSVKYEDITNWRQIQEAYSTKDMNNQKWIYKDFIGNKCWMSAQGMKDLISGKTLNDFSVMIDEALNSVEVIISLDWYRCSAVVVPRVAVSWYRS